MKALQRLRELMSGTVLSITEDGYQAAREVWNAAVPLEMLGAFNAPLAEEFWRAVASSGLLTLHVVCHGGRNTHHIVEGIFKATARALREAVEVDPRMHGVPSTKGVL